MDNNMDNNMDKGLFHIDENFAKVVEELQKVSEDFLNVQSNIQKQLSGIQKAINSLALNIAKTVDYNRLVTEANNLIKSLSGIEGQLKEAEEKTIPGLEKRAKTAEEELRKAKEETIPALIKRAETAEGKLETAEKGTIPELKQKLNGWDKAVEKYSGLYDALVACDTMKDYYDKEIKAGTGSKNEELIKLISAVAEKELSLDFAKKVYAAFEKVKSEKPEPMNEKEVDFIEKVNDFYKSTGCEFVQNGIFEVFDGLNFGEKGRINFDKKQMIGIENRDNDEFVSCTSVCVPLLRRTDGGGIAKKALVLAKM